MRPVKLLCIAQLAAVGFLSGQESWHFQNPVPTSSHLRSVCFVDENTGWAAGWYGTIINTTDGGRTWHFQEACNADWIGQVFFVDAKTGWATGGRLTGGESWYAPVYEPVLLHTKDGGLHWSLQFSLDTSAGDWGRTPIFFTDGHTGWMVGSVGKLEHRSILKTTDAGEHWSIQGNTGWGTLSLFFVDTLTGWAVGGESEMSAVSILKTSDGGEHWISQSGGVNGFLESVFFVDDTTGWAVGAPNITLKTTNGGMDWTQQSGNVSASSVYFANADRGFATGWGGFFLTTDGGNHWEVQPTAMTALSVCCVNNDIGWRVGNNGTIQKTTDGGWMWEFQSKTFTSGDLRAVDFVDQLSGWVVGEGWPGIYHSSDGGGTWEAQDSTSSTMPYFTDLNDLFFYDSMNGWATGRKAVSGNHDILILHTSNGGKYWEEQAPSIRGNLYAITFVDQNTGWAVGEGGTILYTKDAGSQWSKQESGTTEILFDVDFVDYSHGWIAGYGGVLRTEDGGVNWEGSLGGACPQSIDFVDSVHGWGARSYSPNPIALGKSVQNVLGDRSVIWNTNDGGMSWTVQCGGNRSTRSVMFLDSLVGWAVGSEVLYTADGGRTWKRSRIPVGSIYSIDFVNARSGWLVGWDGAIMHTSDGGVTFFEGTAPRDIPRQLHLSQNYPNPFNPSTTIKYELPKSSEVRLSVYDMLGREVSVLVNDRMDAGVHEVRFDGSNLATGVYMSRLTAGSNVQSRKLLLLR